MEETNTHKNNIHAPESTCEQNRVTVSGMHKDSDVTADWKRERIGGTGKSINLDEGGVAVEETKEG